MLDMNYISKLIVDNGHTYASIEKAVGFGNGSIKRWGISSPSIDKLFRLANYLNMPVSRLLGEDVAAPTSPDTRELIYTYEQLDPQGKIIVKAKAIEELRRLKNN